MSPEVCLTAQWPLAGILLKAGNGGSVPSGDSHDSPLLASMTVHELLRTGGGTRPAASRSAGFLGSRDERRADTYKRLPTASRATELTYAKALTCVNRPIQTAVASTGIV